jgi:hypothetical protein
MQRPPLEAHPRDEPVESQLRFGERERDRRKLQQRAPRRVGPQTPPGRIPSLRHVPFVGPNRAVPGTTGLVSLARPALGADRSIPRPVSD